MESTRLAALVISLISFEQQRVYTNGLYAICLFLILLHGAPQFSPQYFEPLAPNVPVYKNGPANLFPV